MSDSINPLKYNFNEYRANQKMNLYGISGGIDYSMLKESLNEVDDIKSEVEDEEATRGVKNSSELLRDIRDRRRDNIEVSSTLSEYSKLTEKASISNSDAAKDGAKIALQVNSTVGGKEGLESFIDKAKNLNSSELNNMFTQISEISNLGTTVEDISNYGENLFELHDIGGSDSLSSYNESIESIVNLDFTSVTSGAYKSEGENKLTTDYTLDTVNSFIDKVGSIFDSEDLSSTEKINSFNNLVDTVKEASADEVSSLIKGFTIE